jgi:hypothetical protein
MPYRQFVTEQIAGDLLDGETKMARMSAFGFFALGPIYYADAGCAPKAQADEMDDRIDTLTRGFLGLSVSCARCHDHKFDPISTKDYYALAGSSPALNISKRRWLPGSSPGGLRQRSLASKNRRRPLKTHGMNATGNPRIVASICQVRRRVEAAQNKRKVDENCRAEIAKEELSQFAVEAWAKFLSGDTLQKNRFLVAFKEAVAQDAKSDLSSSPPRSLRFNKVADQLQMDIAAASKTPCEGRSKRTAEELPERHRGRQQGPCGIQREQKDQIEKLISEDRRKKMTSSRRSSKNGNKSAKSIPWLTASRTGPPRTCTSTFAATTRNKGTRFRGGSWKSSARPAKPSRFRKGADG